MNLSLMNQLKSFYKRRIAIPVGKNDLVLDIGSGDKPHWRADVLLDQYVEESDGIQRSGSNDVIVSKPLIVAPMENMPFKDKAFDYIICSHIVEHVMDPVKSLKEIMRVGKAGYIEVPFEGAAKIVDVPSHLWYCRKEKDTLILTAKKRVAFDTVIDSLMNTPEMLYGFASLGQKNWDKFIIEFYWKDKIKFKVIGKASKKIFNDAQKAEVIHNKKNFLFRNILNMLIPLMMISKKHSGKQDLVRIMQCNRCRGSVEKKGFYAVCRKCRNKIRILE